MMEIDINQKWICLEDNNILGDDGDIVHQFKIGDIIQITKVDLNQPYPYYFNLFMPLNKKEIINNFILLAELREQKINEILSDD